MFIEFNKDKSSVLINMNQVVSIYPYGDNRTILCGWGENQAIVVDEVYEVVLAKTKRT